MCTSCLAEKYEISKPLADLNLHALTCKRCGRWRVSTQGKTSSEHWIDAQLESKELLSFLVKSLERQLRKASLTISDAQWVWTEPHSRRLRLRLVLRRHVDDVANGGGVVLETSKTLEWVVNTRQCPQCASENATGGGEPWRAVVQLRHHVDGGRNMLASLEQRMLESGVGSSAIGIEQLRNGLDFYFLEQNDAIKLSDWVKSNVPTRMKTSTKLVSHDPKSNKQHTKFTISIDIVPLRKDSLVSIAQSAQNQTRATASSSSPLYVLTKMSSALHLVQVQPPTMRRLEMTSEQYHRSIVEVKAAPEDLIPYTILSVDEQDGSSMVQVVRAADLGVHQVVETMVRTHLKGPALGVEGDLVLGYDIQGSDVSSSTSQGGDVVLVRRASPTESQRYEESLSAPSRHEVDTALSSKQRRSERRQMRKAKRREKSKASKSEIQGNLHNGDQHAAPRAATRAAE